MRKIIALMFVLSVTQLGYADMLAYEGFDYTAGLGALSGANGGFGFADVWSSDANVVPDSLTTVSGFGMTSVGGAFEWSRGLGTTHSRPLNFSIPCEPVVEQVYYISVLFKYVDAATSGSSRFVQFAGFNSDSSSVMVWAGKGSDPVFYAEFGGESVTTGNGVFRSNNTYLWVVKLTVRPGDDTISGIYYGAGEDTIRDEPKEDMWDYSLTKAWPDDMSKIAIKMGSNTDKIYFDEIRIGESWEDVVNNTYTYDSIPNVPFDRGLIMQVDGDHIWNAYEADMTKRVFSTINQAKDNSITYGGKGPDIMPELQDNALNGHPIMDFDGNDYLHCAARSYMGNFPMTMVFVVFRPDVITSAGMVMRSAYDDIDGAGRDGDLMSLYVENSKLYAQWRTVTGGGRAGSYDITGMEGQWMISNFWWDGWKIWHQLNGPSATHTADNATGMPNGHTKSRLGSHTGGTALFDGAIAEVLIYNRVLTRDQQSIVGAYLSEKYGLTNDYPAVVVNDCEDYVRNYGSELADWNQDCQINGYDLLGMVADWLDSPLD